jgi:hypothetical protein
MEVGMSTAEGETTDDARDRWGAFMEERKTLFQTAKEASDQYSKAILTLAGGSLALSITFIEKIAPTPIEGSLLFLALAWIVYAMSMLVTTTSFLLGQFAYMRQIDISEAALLDPTGQSVTISNRYVPWMKGLDVAGLLLFAAGLVLTLLFATMNLKGRAKITPVQAQPAAAQASPKG